MKGVSAIIATILLLMITIGLVGSAYVFISGMLTGKTRSAFEILDSSDYLLIVKNIGTEPIDKFTAVVDNKNVDISIKEGSIPVNGVGTIILEDINPGYHNMMINTPSMSQRWRWDYKFPYSVVETQFFSQGASDWTAVGGNWIVQDGVYNQTTTGVQTYSYTDVNTDFNASYQLDFEFLSSTSVNISIASSTNIGDGITTVFDKSASQIRLLRSGNLVDSTSRTFTSFKIYSVKIEVGNGPYKLYLDGQHISDLDNTLNPTWIRGKYLQLITSDARANFDNIIVGSLSTVATTTTSTTGTTTTSTSTTSTVGTTTSSTSTTTTAGTTTTSTTSTSTSSTSTSSTTSSTTTTAPSCSSCPDNVCFINCGQTLLGRYTTTQEYFNFTLSSPRNVNITVTPAPTALYDLYLKWTAGICPTTSNWDCRPLKTTGVPQNCYYSSLPAGNYSIYVKCTQCSNPLSDKYDIFLNCT